mgnify:CR=1 FL=1
MRFTYLSGGYSSDARRGIKTRNASRVRVPKSEYTSGAFKTPRPSGSREPESRACKHKAVPLRHQDRVVLGNPSPVPVSTRPSGSREPESTMPFRHGSPLPSMPLYLLVLSMPSKAFIDAFQSSYCIWLSRSTPTPPTHPTVLNRLNLKLKPSSSRLTIPLTPYTVHILKS